MLSPTFVLWDVGCSLYTYGSIFIIALVIWHVKRSRQRLRFGPNKSCYKCHQRIKQKSRDRTSRASRTSKEETEKLQKLLATMKSQGWLPQEGSVRRLLCSDPSCPVCNAMALEIQQLLRGGNKQPSHASLRQSKSFPSLQSLAPSKAVFDKSLEFCSQHSGTASWASSFTQSQSTDHKSSTQSAAPSTGDANSQHYCPGHQQKQEPQGSNVSQDAGSLSSSSMEEPGIPASQQKRKKKDKRLVLKSKAPSEAEGENKMTFFSHWVNPEVKCERQEEPIVPSKSEAEAKPKKEEPKNCHAPPQDRAEGAGMKKTTRDPEAKPLCAKNNIDGWSARAEEVQTMLSSPCFLWDSEYSLYVCFCILILILITWQVQQSYCGLKCQPKRSCCRRHRKVKQRARAAAWRARRLCQEETEKPWELLSVMKSQSWLPKEEDVRQLLCVDPGCQVCDAATLEIQHLLGSEKSQPPPVFLGLPQGSSCTELLPTSTVSSEETLEPYTGRSDSFPLLPRTPTLMRLPGQSVQLADAGEVQQCWADHLQAGQDFYLADAVPVVSNTMAPSRLEEPVVLMIEEEMMHSDLNFIQEIQDHDPALNSQIPLQTLNPEITQVTQPTALSIVTTIPQPFHSPGVFRLLELHVKKLMHFQRWGLPRRVEESLRQLMPNPPMYFQPENEQPGSFNLNNNTHQEHVHRFGSISQQTWSSYMSRQPTQTFWVSEWPNVDQNQRLHSEQISSRVEKLSPMSDHEVLRTLCLLPEGQANDPRHNLQKKFTQLFCGSPSMHSESLVYASLDTQGLSKDTVQPSYQEPHVLREPPSLPSLAHTPRNAALLPSRSPNESSSHEQQGAQLGIPFLTLAESKTLEWHLLRRQLQLQWGLPAANPLSPYVRSPVPYKPCNKAKPHKALKGAWPRKSFSVLTRDLFFFPEHARRLLEFHLQKQLIHLRWGLPRKIQRSIHLVLSSTEQQPLSCSSRVLPSVSIPGDPKADGSGDTFSPTVGSRSIPAPHLFAQARAVLKRHVDSKCDQILEGKAPACVQSSWQGKLPGSLAARTSFPDIAQGPPVELQTENNPDLHHKLVPWKPTDLDEEKRALSGALVEHCKRPQALPEETIKKLETTLRHKYLAFLSGLPGRYCVGPSRTEPSATAGQSAVTETVPRPVKSPWEPLSQMTPLEDPSPSELKPCTQGDSDVAKELQPEVQVEGGSETQPPPKGPCSLNTVILERMSFHLKKKLLEIKLGIPLMVSEYKELTAAAPEAGATQEPRRSLSIPESPVLQQQPIACDSPPAPQANSVHLKRQQAAAAQAAYKEPKQPSPQAAPHGSAQGASKASQFSRNMIEVQVHCVQMETTGEKPSPKDPFSTELQSPGKSLYSALVPTWTEKREEPRKPKAVGNLGEGDAGLGLFPASEKTHQDGDRKKHRMTQASVHHGHSSHLMDTYRPSPWGSPELGFPDPPPEVLMEAESAHGMQVGQSKASVTQEPSRMVLRLSQASHDLPLPRPPVQGKPFLGQTWQGHSSPGQVMPVSPHIRPSLLPEAGLKNKVKSFLQSINPMIKGKPHTQSPTACTPRKVAKPSKGNAKKGLPQAKSPARKTKTENSRGPKAQPASSEKSVIASFLTASHNPDSKLPPPRARQLGSASVPGQPRHCPRHCPKLSCYAQHRNPR
ncbi:LOW QUALITY PROTEIN: protein FAM205A-2-like [Acomys russatus]|uniref:LOW QUALITY PROTEIN: protein FAM205A-2-like n=1 Tax=Acomys russatus TaxID=60746 RepID=UPI0021E1FEA6|nr:LOW QUALITY PROTEIN: protein FAM205A-2-like [Acomys russatus]